MTIPPLLDPVTLKEIYGISRRGQTYFGRVIYVGLIALILYEFWSNTIRESPFLSPSEYAALGARLFKVFVPLQMLMVTLAAIGASADRVVREEQAGTLGLLLLTPLSARRIAFSKWMAATAQAGSLILCGIPVVAVCVYLGSVGPWDLLWCFSLTGAAAMLSAAFGLRASATQPTVPRAIVMGVLYMVGYALLPLTLLFIGGATAWIAAPFLHPGYAAGWMVLGRLEDTSILNYAWIPSTIASFFTARFIVGGVGTLIEARVRNPRGPLMPAETDSVTLSRAARAVGERPTRAVWERDPLLWKELLTRMGGRWSSEVKSMATVYSLIFIVLCWLFSRLGNSMPTFAFLGSLFAVLALINGSALFAPDKEGRRMEMLLSAPVTSFDIVRSKLLSGLASPEALRVWIVATGTAVAFTWWTGPGILVAIGVLLLFLMFTFLLSAAASLQAATLQGAALASAGILCCILLVLPILITVLTPPARYGQPLSVPLYLLSALNPVWVLDPLEEPRMEGVAGAFHRFLLFTAVYGGVCAALLAWILRRFDRSMGRV